MSCSVTGMVAGLKWCAFELSGRSGLTRRLAASRWRQRRLLILCYHGVSLADEHEWNPELYISPLTLEKRFDALARMGCTVLPLDEAVRRLYDGTLPDRAVALTFDDGFYDFKARALPLLQARDLPATVYVTTQRAHRNPTVAHLLTSYMLWKLGRVKGAVGHEAMEQLSVESDGMLHARLLSVMTPEELAGISAAGIAIEMHTHRHVAPIDPDEFMDDVRTNREAIAGITGRQPQHLCYPSGIYRPGYLSRLAADAVETATTCDPGLASAESHPLMLPRFVDSEACHQLTFEAWVAGVATWLPRRTRTVNAA